MKFIRRLSVLPAAMRFSLRWDRSLHLASTERLNEALAALDSIEPRFAEDLEVLVLRVSLLWQLGKFEEVTASSDQILPKLATDKRIKPEDKRYLHAFVWGLRDTAEASLGGQRHNIADMKKVDWSEIDLARVSRHFKANYPLRAHPLWDRRL